MKKLPWTQEEIDILRNNFLSENGKVRVCELLTNRTRPAIMTKASDLKLNPLKNYYKNENFFEVPNTLNSSISGIIASDGHMYMGNKKDGGRVEVYQNTEDEEMLEQIKIATESNHIIKRRKRKYHISMNRKQPSIGIGYSSTLSFYNPHKWIKDINKNWNIPIGHKSYIINSPPIIFNNLDYQLAYIYGLISGDGSVYIKGRSLTITIRATLPLLTWCKQVVSTFLKENLNTTITKEKNSKYLYFLDVNGYKAIRLFEKMRSLNCVKLSRKWDNPAILAHIVEKRANPLFLQRLDNPKKKQESLSQPAPSSVNTHDILVNTV